MTSLAQAYSIDRSIDRSIDGRRPALVVLSYGAICPSGGGETSLSLEARKSAASLEELRDVRSSQTDWS